MNKKYVLVVLAAFFSLNLSAQFTKYIVKFKDKNGTPFSIDDPSKFLSQRAIERRIKQNISINETDLPIVPAYIDSVRLSGNVIVLDQSKWLNQVCIETADSTALQKIDDFSFSELEIDTTLTRTAISEHTIANGFNENIQSAAVNLIWNPVSKVAIGLEYMYGWRYLAKAATTGGDMQGNASRLQLGMQYFF